MKRVVVLILALSLLTSRAVAQIDYGNADEFTKSEAQARKAARQFPGLDTAGDLPYLNRNSDSAFYPRNVGAMPESEKNAGPSYYCNDGTCEKGTTPEYKSYNAGTGSIPANRGFVNIYGSMTGFGEYMNSKAQIDQKFESVGSVAALANITLVMTEPGVAGGLHNAWMQTYADLNNKYLSDIHLMKQFELNPAVGTPAFEAWAACISKELRGLKSQEVIVGNERNGVDVASKGKTWLEAQAICSLDRSGADPSKLNPNKERFEKAVEGETKQTQPNQATGFRFEHAWDWDGDELQKSQVDSFTDDRRFYALKLTDMLFPKEFKTTGGSGGGLPELKKAFREVIGDVSFQFLERTDDDQAKREAREGARVLAYNVVRPAKTQELWFRERFEKVYKTLVEVILKKYCDERGKSDKTLFFVEETEWKEHLPVISAGSFLAKPGLVRMFWENYERAWEDKQQGPVDCSPFQSGGVYSYDHLMGNDRFDPAPNAAYADQLSHFLVAYVDSITALQLYSLYVNALDIVSNMPDFAMDGMVRRAAMQLIKTAAGTDDPKSVFDQTLTRLNEQIIPTYMIVQSAKGGGWSVGANFSSERSNAESYGSHGTDRN